MKKNTHPKVEEEMPIPPSIKVGEYHTMFKIGLMWILPFVVSVVISGMMGSYKYIAIFTIAASVWGLALRHLSKRMIEMGFTENSISVDDNEFLMGDIESYYTCLPLRKFFMLRLQMKDGKRYICYIPIEFRNEVDSYMAKRASLSKQKQDVVLCYSHYIFALVYMIVFSFFLIIMSKYNMPFRIIK